MKFRLHYRLVLLLFFYFLAACFVFFLFRLSFLVRFGDFSDILNSYKWDLLKAFGMGARFDAKVLALLLSPLFALCLIALPFSRVSSALAFFFLPWLVLQSVLLYLLLFIDQFYYGYFQNHIDIRIFGFIEDDTQALIKTFWQEYPILTLFFVLLLLSTLTAWLLWKLQARLKNIEAPAYFLRLRAQVFFVVFTLLFMIFFARGSFGIFPLTREDRSVSAHQFLNFLAYNGIVSFYNAWEDREESLYSTDMSPILAKYEHKNIQEALQNYYQISRPQAPFRKYMFRKAEAAFSPPAKKYHLVLIIMESWSAYYFRWHSPSFNLLGRLEKHWDSLIHFPYFFSSQNGTITSLESLLIQNSESILSQTKYRSHSFSTAITAPFLQAGYETHFISSGKLSWRDLNLFLPKQGFEKLSGKAKLESVYGSRQTNVWGVFDKYMFDFTLETLQRASRPQFLVNLSTSHHPPYRVPRDYQASALNIPASLDPKLKAKQDLARRAFLSFQYANDTLGFFLEKIKASKLAEETVIVMTGDHNTWALFDYGQEKLHWKYAVPLVFYLPPKLREKIPFTEGLGFGSHDDILPTLMALLLPESNFLQIGHNLLAPQKAPSFAMNAAGWVLNQEGAVSLRAPPLFYKWSDSRRQKLLESPPQAELIELRRRAQARKVIMNYALRTDLDKDQ